MRAGALARLAAVLAGAWAGTVAAIAFVGAPLAFSTLVRADAGRLAARLFAVDAAIGLVAGAVLLVVVPRLPPRGASGAVPSTRYGLDLGLVLAALACVVVGHYGLQPWFEAARSGGGPASFAALHRASAAFVVVKLAAVVALAWRLAGRIAELSAPTAS